jgi:murein L,D-transpeptidase YafK
LFSTMTWKTVVAAAVTTTVVSVSSLFIQGAGATRSEVAPGQIALANNLNQDTIDGKHARITESFSEAVLLTVDKSQLRAELRTWPSGSDLPKTLGTFTIAVGKQRGDKQKEGDNKTPEGIYFTKAILDGANLPEKYGPKAIPIDFPNALDRRRHISGHGIWLHGVENNARIEEANVTEGCVAFYNEDIQQLVNWLRPHQGMVVIAENGEQVNLPKDIEALRTRNASWAESWAKRDLDGYVAHYSEEFTFRGMSREEFKSYKSKVFAGYKSMKVDIQDVRVVTHPKYAVTLMHQDFDGDGRFISKGRKVLYWTKTADGQWQIAEEDYDNRRIEQVQITPDATAALPKTASNGKPVSPPQSSSL